MTLDIELQLAVAPEASAILVYAGGNMNSLVVQQYQKIADDNLAKEISTSWGAPEITNDSVSLDGENDAFEQMASQGQSIFAAAGDNGAYDGAGTSSTVNGTDPTALLVDDPSSQPYMCGVGGTTLAVMTPGTNEHYLSETSWGTPATSTGGGGGGGISRLWPTPFYQVGIVPSAGAIPSNYTTAGTDLPNPNPSTSRNTPDVSFDANPDTGYDIVFGGVADAALTFGGTSCAAPIWAGFTALANEERANNGLPPLGFANPAIYQIGADGYSGYTFRYPTVFHDIMDGSTNLYFPAVKGYDSSTGWGSFNGNYLQTDLGSPPPLHFGAKPADQAAYLAWNAAPAAKSYNLYRVNGTSAMFLANVPGTTYIDKNLTNGTAYYYEIRAVYSGGQSLYTEPFGTHPTTVKIISGPFLSTGTGTATITWGTSAESNEKVVYGTSKTSLTKSVSSATFLLNHSLQITGLTTGVTYYYQVSSFDGFLTATSAVGSFTAS